MSNSRTIVVEQIELRGSLPLSQPVGRIDIIELDPKRDGHKDDRELQVTKNR
jgi:hypothetical protein